MGGLWPLLPAEDCGQLFVTSCAMGGPPTALIFSPFKWQISITEYLPFERFEGTLTLESSGNTLPLICNRFTFPSKRV